MFICCLYIPPNSSIDVYRAYCKALSNFFDAVAVDCNDLCLILGDFNLPLVKWIPDNDDKWILLPTNHAIYC